MSNISEKAVIGSDCILHSNIWIGDTVRIGNGVRIQAFAFIPNGVTIEDDVFIGPGVIFTNDRNPPSSDWSPIIVGKGAVIGAGAKILAGTIIGAGAKIGMGAVVLNSVLPNTTVVGIPARVIHTDIK